MPYNWLQMFPPKEPVVTRFDIIRTVSMVITAVCLLFISITMIVAGAYTVSTVTHIQNTYHPERLSSMLSDASDAIHTIHSTTSMLQSSEHGTPNIMEHVAKLIETVEDLSTALKTLHVDNILLESTQWRDMATSMFKGLKNGLPDL